MKSPYFIRRNAPIFILALLLLSGCNLPRAGTGSDSKDVTQAYQTVQVQLTQVAAGTLTLNPPLQLEDSVLTLTPDYTQTTALDALIETPGKRCDQAAAAYPKIDITIEDDTEMSPGEAFTKIWRVVNAGTCTWTPDYTIVLFSGEQLGALPNIPLNATVHPNESIDLSVDMVAPDQPGTFQGNWKLRSADGTLFGIGPNGESPLWVRIMVIAVATITPTPTFTPTPPVQASGSATLSIDDALDLDNLLTNAGGTDLIFEKTIIEPPRYQLVPFGPYTMGLFGDTQPTLEDCQVSPLAASPILLDDLATGVYLCYRTDLGLPGWVRIDGFDPETGRLDLYIFTWKLP